MSQKGKIIKLLKGIINDVDMTEEQVHFLLNNYKDEDTIIGIYNTYQNYNDIFEKGIEMQNVKEKETRDLTSTIMYSDNIVSLSLYPIGTKYKEGTAILLKIPKKVFLKEQGILEYMDNGTFMIPKQFIIGAFNNKEVIENTNYDKDYDAAKLFKCKNEVVLCDKEILYSCFKKVYARNEFIKKIKEFLRKIGIIRDKLPLLEAPKEESITTEI